MDGSQRVSYPVRLQGSDRRDKRLKVHKRRLAAVDGAPQGIGAGASRFVEEFAHAGAAIRVRQRTGALGARELNADDGWGDRSPAPRLHGQDRVPLPGQVTPETKDTPHPHLTA